MYQLSKILLVSCLIIGVGTRCKQDELSECEKYEVIFSVTNQEGELDFDTHSNQHFIIFTPKNTIDSQAKGFICGSFKNFEAFQGQVVFDGVLRDSQDEFEPIPGIDFYYLEIEKIDIK